MLVRHPFMTQRTMGLIHWHGAPPVAAWRARPPPRRGGTMNTRTVTGRISAASEPVLGSAGTTHHPGLRQPGPGRSPGRRPARTAPAGRSATRRPIAPRRSGSTTARRIVRLLLGGATGAGEAYMDGLWSSPDLTRVLELGRPQPTRRPRPPGGWWRAPARLRRLADASRPAQHAAAAAAGTSPPTTTWATTSIGCSWTRR